MVDKLKSDARVIAVLRASRVFGLLDEPVIHALAGVLKLRNVRGGSEVVREGADSDSMMFVVSGGLRVSRRDGAGVVSLYNEIRPGESFGEIGLILSQQRTADVTAVRDSILAVLNKADFEALLLLHPLALNRVFVQAVYNLLRHEAQLTERHHAQSFVVVPLNRDARAEELADSLTQAFARIGKAHRIAPPDEGDLEMTAIGGVQEIAGLDELEETADFLVYLADPTPSSWTRRAFRQADQVIFVATADAPQAMGELEQRLRDEPGFSMKRQHLVILHPSGTAVPSNLRRWRNGRDYERMYPIRAGNDADFGRLARFLTGTAVGVVLGGGGARGFAHLGVLRALEESGVPIDLIGGNSMGSLIGAQYACDVPLDEIRERTRVFCTGGERPTLPLISLVSGKRVERDLRKMFGETQADGLWRPFFAAACNLSKGYTTVQDSGPLWRAVLASNSPAGLLPPVLFDGDLLVDGAILENVPVGAMRQRLGTPLEKRRGNGTIIAIDVDVSEEMCVDASLTRLSVWQTLKGYFLPGTVSTPGIVEIMYRAGHIGGLSQRSRTVAQADHYLEPPVAGYSLMSYRHASAIADVGYRYGLEHIATWNRQPTRL